MTAYSVSSTGSSDSLSSVPPSPTTTTATATDTTPALLSTEDATKFFITTLTPKGYPKTFTYKHRDLFDWTSAAAVSKLNKWRSQILRRTTKQKKRDPKAKYLRAENDFITEAHRVATEAGLRIDWAKVTEAFNERFEGVVIEVVGITTVYELEGGFQLTWENQGSDEPRPARTQKSLVTQRDRIEEVRRIRKTPNARKKEVEAKGKGKAKATAEEVAAWEDEEEEVGDGDDGEGNSEYEYEEEEDEDDE
ncbi:MAG: hypothetical protein M1835_003160 [Candelina submexicana]|nr:MAG: hypothetical protein M1835_003160 [Candelina submexicana]